MVRVDADTVAFEVKGILTELRMTKLILVEVRPTPNSGIDDVGKPLSTSNLNSTKQSKLESPL